MPFDPTDLYSASAGTKLSNYFNPFVTKFDSQSFYNFEQDNEPLFDLEERTHYLWEKATGFATSSLAGMPLVVSGSLATDNPNVFTSVQDAIDALPNVIITPTLIEVAASGELGGLDLQNIEVKGDGVLEIINRGHAKIYTGAGNHNFTSVVETSSIGYGHGSNTGLNLRGVINNLSSIDLSTTITNTAVASLYGKGADVFCVSSLFTNNRCHRTFVQYMNLQPTTGRRNDIVTCGFIGVSSNTIEFLKHTGLFNLPGFERATYGISTNNISDPTIVEGYDVSCFRSDVLRADNKRFPNGNVAFINRNGSMTNSGTFDQVGGNTYANTLSSISVENCNGPIYIRGFCVDGVRGADTAYGNSPYHARTGISVKNSNIDLENCAAMRSIENGAEFINSDVTLSRGFFAYRNYEIVSSARAGYETAGIRASNSRINLKPSLYYASGVDYNFNTQAHTYGAILDNCVVTGGQSRPAANSFETTLGFSYNDIGIKADNTIFDVSGNLDVYNNNKGLVLNNSRVSSDRLTVENNNDEGILANNSQIIYNNTYTRNTYINDVSGARTAQTLLQRNGVHMHLMNSSKFSHDLAVSSSNIGVKFGLLKFHDSHGTVNPGTNATRFNIPGVLIDNSEANIINARLSTSALAYNQTGVLGGCIHANNGSQVNFMGSVSGTTILAGPANDNTIRATAAYADNGSKLSFRGPTVIGQFGNGVVANNNSTAEFCPHKKGNAELDIEGFNLTSPYNHTSVEIHTNFHSCIVANNNSQVILEDLGHPNSYVSAAGGGSLFANSDSPATLASYTSAGSMQFYPNPSKTALVGARNTLSSLSVDAAAYDQMTRTKLSTGIQVNYHILNPNTTTTSALVRDNISVGGLCVQAVGDSVVKATNVHFPAGHVNTPGSFYDSSNTPLGCNQLRMWNIADNSKLYASHLAVAGLTPSACGHSSAPRYYGPRSVYFSGLVVPDENATGTLYDDSGAVAASADPHSPDTSGISVLDFFGFGVQIKGDRSGTIVNPTFMSNEIQALNKARNGVGTAGSPGSEIFGNLHYENRGPFRLFFSTKAEARLLGYVSGNDNIHDGKSIYGLGDTRPMQHISQGYSLSGPVGVNPAVASVSANTAALFARNPYHPTQHPGASSFDFSGYYFASSLMSADRGTQVYLDESAANTFANAKNAAMKPMFGRANPKVSIYSSTTTKGGEGAQADELGSGEGLGSINIFDSRRQL